MRVLWSVSQSDIGARTPRGAGGAHWSRDEVLDVCSSHQGSPRLASGATRDTQYSILMKCRNIDSFLPAW